MLLHTYILPLSRLLIFRFRMYHPYSVTISTKPLPPFPITLSFLHLSFPSFSKSSPPNSPILILKLPLIILSFRTFLLNFFYLYIQIFITCSLYTETISIFSPFIVNSDTITPSSLLLICLPYSPIFFSFQTIACLISLFFSPSMCFR